MEETINFFLFRMGLRGVPGRLSPRTPSHPMIDPDATETTRFNLLTPETTTVDLRIARAPHPGSVTLHSHLPLMARSCECRRGYCLGRPTSSLRVPIAAMIYIAISIFSLWIALPSMPDRSGCSSTCKYHPCATLSRVETAYITALSRKCVSLC
jgi:hypothetical protein